jgi:Fe-S cluster assembly protein SufD
VTLNANSEAKLFNAKTDAAKSRFAAHILCKGEGARADITGLCLTDSAALAESFIDIRHMCAGTLSSQLYHAIVGGKAQSTYTGKVTVAREAQKTDAQQLSRGLLLSPMATNFVKPELEIYADDVQCAHGATTGDLDEEALFYMRSRGLPENEAKRLLIEAFCGAPLARLDENSLLKEALEEGLKAKLEVLLS